MELVLDERITESFIQQNGFQLDNHLIMACYVGSHSHGTYEPHDENSIDDTDYMLVVLPPATRLLGLSKWDHWTFQEAELDVTVYSLEKYMRLLLKCNPNVVGTLYLREQDYIFRSNPFKVLQEMRNEIVSMHAYPAFMGYAQAQLKRLLNGAYQGYMGAKRKALVDKYGYDPKNAAHLIRLYRMGLEFMFSGELEVYRHDREELKAIKRGEWTLEQITAEATKLEELMKMAKQTSIIAKEPNWKKAEEFLIDTSAVEVLYWWHEKYPTPVYN